VSAPDLADIPQVGQVREGLHTAAVGLVVSLAVDALVVLLSRQSDFRETHDDDSQPR